MARCLRGAVGIRIVVAAKDIVLASALIGAVGRVVILAAKNIALASPLHRTIGIKIVRATTKGVGLIAAWVGTIGPPARVAANAIVIGLPQQGTIGSKISRGRQRRSADSAPESNRQAHNSHRLQTRSARGCPGRCRKVNSHLHQTHFVGLSLAASRQADSSHSHQTHCVGWRSAAGRACRSHSRRKHSAYKSPGRWPMTAISARQKMPPARQVSLSARFAKQFEQWLFEPTGYFFATRTPGQSIAVHQFSLLAHTSFSSPAISVIILRPDHQCHLVSAINRWQDRGRWDWCRCVRPKTRRRTQ